MGKTYYEIDVFGAEPFSGNPVGVVFEADELSTKQMQDFARWTNLSETTFVLTPTDDKANYGLRIFTPTSELPFAGHPTLGTAKAWLDYVGAPTKNELIQECGIGLIEVLQNEDKFSFKSPELIRGEALSSQLLTEVALTLNIEKSKILDSKWIDNGPGWIGVLLSSAEEVLAITPNRNSNLALGLFGFYDAGSKYMYEVRGFYPEDGLLVEDPATGSLHASGAQWLISAGKCVAPYLASQGKVINRNGEIYVTSDADQEIWIGGRAEIRIKGEVTF